MIHIDFKIALREDSSTNKGEIFVIFADPTLKNEQICHDPEESSEDHKLSMIALPLEYIDYFKTKDKPVTIGQDIYIKGTKHEILRITPKNSLVKLMKIKVPLEGDFFINSTSPFYRFSTTEAKMDQNNL